MRAGRMGIAAFVLLGVACGSPAPPGAGGSPGPSPSPAPASPTGDPLAGSAQVRFRASDGVRLTGRLFGTGRVAVVLAHQIDDDQSDWFDFAATLRSRGYQALTFNFRGVCSSTPVRACSGGGVDPNESPSDVTGAVRFVRSQGAKGVFLIGASVGGEAVILAASKLGPDIEGVISLSASKGLVGLLDPKAEYRMVAAIDVPKLFVAGEMDQSFADAARDYFEHAVEPKQLRLFPLGDHGVALLHSAQGGQVQDLIFDFLTSNGPGG